MKSKTTTKTLVILAALSPLIYLLISWPSIPENFTTRFELDGSFEKIQSRSELLFSSIALTTISVILYLVMRNLKRFDPKVTASTPTSTFHKFGLISTLFMMAINYFLILSAKYGWVIDTRIAVAFFGFLVLVLGNYMNNLKPNYIAGIRLPWTLNDAENWRKTHLFAGKVWFAGGMLLILTSFFIPKGILGFLLTGLMIVLVLIPGIYSYRLYKNKIN